MPSADEVAEGAAEVADSLELPARPKGRKPSATMDELLAIGRTAPRGRNGRISRRNVEAEVRAEGHSVAKDRLADAVRMLQAELDAAKADAEDA